MVIKNIFSLLYGELFISLAQQKHTMFMKRNLFLRLCLILTVMLFLYSCIHDELYSSSDRASNEYQSKSLWKEDEIYIQNVMKIYDEHQEEIKKDHGTPLWNYAMTMDKFNESYLMVPVRKNGEITEVLEVPRFGTKVYFRYTHAEDKVSFFSDFLIEAPKKVLPTSFSNELSKIVCVLKSFQMWYPDNQNDPNGSGHWGNSYYTHCYDENIDSFENPDDGSGDGGYEYPPFGGSGEINPTDSTQVPKTPCEKLKLQNNAAFKDKVSELDKDSIFNKKKETGFANAYGNTPYEALQNSEDGNVKLPIGNKYFGFMHVHLNKAGVIKIFSPADITTFLTSCIRNAQQVGNMADAYAMVITSQGNYILKYSGDGSYSIGPNQINNWQIWYETEFAKIANEDGTFSQNNIEKLFAQFIQEKVNIAGLEVYKTDKITGNASKLQYNGLNNPVQSIPCPQ